MPRFFLSAGGIAGGRATVRGADAAHLARSLRVRSGQTVVVVEATAEGPQEHGVVVDEVRSDLVAGAVAWSRPAGGEARCRVHVVQAVPTEGFDDTVAALAQVGAAVIAPVVSRRTVPRPDAERAARRLRRWTAIAREAAALAGRAAPPEVRPLHDLAGAVAALPRPCRILACASHPSAVAIAALPLAQVGTVALCIGPEGGLDAGELDMLTGAGAVVVHLGPRVLPARLAGVIATALVLAAAGDLDTGVAPPPRADGDATLRAP